MMVLYPKDTYSVPNSVYSDTTVAKINGVEVEISEGENGEIVVHIPSGLDNGKITIELTNSEDSLTIDNVFYLNDPSIPIYSGSASRMCSNEQFYNANGVLTTGTKNCSGPADCTTDGEVGCVATSAVPGALATNLNPADIRNGQTIGGVTGSFSGAGARPNCDGSRVDDCTANPSYPAMEFAGAAAKILSGQSLGGVSGTYTPDFPDASSVLDSDTTNFVTGTIVTRNTWDMRTSFPGSGYYTGISNAPVAAELKRSIQVAGVTGNFPSSASPLPRYSDASSVATSGSDETDLTTFASQLTNDASFEFWDSNGQRYLASGDSDLSSENIVAGVVIESLSITGSANLSQPTNFQASANAGANDVDLSWDDIGAAGYLVVANVGDSVSFVPTNGTSYSLPADATQGSDEIIYVGSAQSTNHLGFAAGSVNYTLYAYNSAYEYSSIPATTSSVGCVGLSGGDWVLVEGNSSYEAQDFCVMKYEAKNVGGVATSQASSSPWAYITQYDATMKCRSLGDGFNLISNDQWMTVSTNIANQASNWSGSSVGSGALNRGRSNTSNSNSLAATAGEGSGVEKRTHTLSNGEVIWDMAGNLNEWTSYYDPNNKPTAATGSEYYVSNSDRATGTTEHPLTEFISQEGIDGNWSRNEGTGALYSNSTDGSGGAFRRGGYWDDGTGAGVFAAGLNSDSSASSTGVGFRCVRL